LTGLESAKGDTVSVMLSNTPAMLEAHHGVPMIGAVLHSINTRLDAQAIAFQLDHADCKVLIVDREFSASWPRRWHWPRSSRWSSIMTTPNIPTMPPFPKAPASARMTMTSFVVSRVPRVHPNPARR
jgi:fatty-acyl-CoA synthase